MKSTLLLIALFLCMPVVFQNYYASDTARGTHVTFKCFSIIVGRRVVSNITNTRIWAPQKLRDGREAVPDYYRSLRSNDLDPYNEKLYDIMRSNFTTAELEMLKQAKASMSIYIVIEPTGEISEVSFQFNSNSLLASIHPDTYYRVEQAIKSQIRFTLDEKTYRLYPWVSELLSVQFEEL